MKTPQLKIKELVYTLCKVNNDDVPKIADIIKEIGAEEKNKAERVTKQEKFPGSDHSVDIVISFPTEESKLEFIKKLGTLTFAEHFLFP